jgi:hypothetical protein
MKAHLVTYVVWTLTALAALISWRVDFLVTCGVRPISLVLMGLVLQTVSLLFLRFRRPTAGGGFSILSVMLGYWIAVFFVLFLFLFNIVGAIKESVGS